MSIRTLRVSKKTEDEVYELVDTQITFGDKGGSMCDYLHGVYEQAFVEGQDTTFLTIGRTGYGKSNLSGEIQIVSQPIIREITGRKRFFDLAQDAFWSGIDYVRGLQPMVLDVAATLIKKTEEEVNELVKGEALLTEAMDGIIKDGYGGYYERLKTLKDKYGFRSKWLDEPQDLNSQDSMNTFNRELVKLKSGTRELNLLETICVPNPWLLAPYVREEKTTAVFFVFPLREAGKAVRAPRRLAIYDLKRYLKLMMSEGRYVRRLMASPLHLIDKFKPALVGNNVPMMPDCREWKIYKVMKMLGTAKLPLQSIERIEEKYGIGETNEPKRKIGLMCPKCGYVWQYGGALGKPSCPNCHSISDLGAMSALYAEDYRHKRG